MSKIAGLYARVSTSRQEEQETIDSQVSELKTRIKRDGNVLPEDNIYVDDGWTGGVLERPGLDAMRDGASLEQFETLYVYDRGRVSRKFAYQEIIIEELMNKRIKFVTLHDVEANTPEEHVLQAMQGVFHEYERVKIAERFRRGKLHKARSGVLINGQALYGYKYTKRTDTEPAKYEIDENEASVVRKIFEWVGMDRMSVYEVQKKLYQQKIPPRKRLKETWSRGPIRRMLRNESYLTGVIYYNKSEAVVAKNPIKKVRYRKIQKASRRVRAKEEWIPYHVEPILLDNGLFQKVQEVLDYYKKYQKKNKKYDYLLSGLVWCQCGHRRVGDGYVGHHYYRCTGRVKNLPLPKTCTAQGVNAGLADRGLWQNLEKFLNDKGQMREQARKWLVKEQSSSTVGQSERKRLELQLVGLDNEKLRYTKTYGNGTIEEAQLKLLLRELDKKKSSLQIRIKDLESEMFVSRVDDDLVDKLCKEGMQVLKQQTQNEKKKLVQDIISKVTFYDKGVVQVEGYIPQFAHKMGYEPKRRNSRITKCGEEYAV